MQEKSITPATPMKPDDGRIRLIEEVGNRCFRCFMSPDAGKVLDVDHIVPIARGGLNVFENYQLLCGPCNSWKGVRIIDFRPGKSRKEIIVDLPIIANDQRVRRNSSYKGTGRTPVLMTPTPEARSTAEMIVIRRLRSELASADATIDGLRKDLDDERARPTQMASALSQRAEAAEARNVELLRSLAAAESRATQFAADLAAERSKPWWRRLFG